MRKYSKLLKQVVLFGLVGVGSLLIDLTVTTSLYDFAHFPAYLAGCLGFSSAFFFNFPLNRKHVFNHTKHDKFSMRTQVILYVCLSLFNLMMTGLFMQLLVSRAGVQVSLAKISVTAVIAIWNFFVFKYLVFSKRPNLAELESLSLL